MSDMQPGEYLPWAFKVFERLITQSDYLNKNLKSPQDKELVISLLNIVEREIEFLLNGVKNGYFPEKNDFELGDDTASRKKSALTDVVQSFKNLTETHAILFANDPTLEKISLFFSAAAEVFNHSDSIKSISTEINNLLASDPVDEEKLIATIGQVIERPLALSIGGTQRGPTQ